MEFIKFAAKQANIPVLYGWIKVYTYKRRKNFEDQNIFNNIVRQNPDYEIEISNIQIYEESYASYIPARILLYYIWYSAIS